ncbi:MAG: hypothetical protein KKD00_03640, partial [Gammaproteobacteria bacterium]|nr:hypothetical protein [Gammaproteobacteria bacterium]
TPGAAELNLRGFAARDSNNPRALSGVSAEDQRGLIGPARLSPPTALSGLVPLLVADDSSTVAGDHRDFSLFLRSRITVA